MRIHPKALFGALLLGLAVLGLARTIGHAQSSASPSARWPQTSVDEWNNGTLDGLIVTNNSGGELRLDQDATRGVYTSAPFQAPFNWTAAAVEWDVKTPGSTTIQAEFRSSPDGTEWREWQALPAPQAISSTLQLLGPFPAPAESRWLQYRLTLSSNSPPVAPEVLGASWLLIDASNGPTLTDQPNRVPASGPLATQTRPPLVIPRAAWGYQASGVLEAEQRPRKFQLTGLLLEQGADPPTMIRALHEIARMYGTPELPYAFLVDSAGNIYQGRNGATDDGALRIALLGESNAASRTALAQLLAWLSQSYRVPLSLSVDGAIASPEAEQIRQTADRSIVRSRSLLAQNNSRDYTERLMLFNPTNVSTDAIVTFFPGQENSSQQTVTVNAGERVNLQLNEILSDTANIPIEVTANQTLVTERTMLFLNDSLNEPGISEPSRTWYFAAGDSTAGRSTTLHLYNPQPSDVAVSLRFYNSNGITRTEELVLTPFENREFAAGADQPSSFGVRVAASAPIAVERTMLFGVNNSGGFLSRGAPVPSRTWYFAEGATIDPFTTTLALLNPSPVAAAITTTFLNEQGDTFVRRYQLPPNSRLDVQMRDIVPTPQGVGTVVTASQPVVVERISYFNNGNAGTSTLGATELAYRWMFAEGRTAAPTDEFIMVSNPNNRPASIRLRIGKDDGSTQTLTYTVPRTGRIAILVDNELPDQQSHTTIVESNLPVVAERTILLTNESGTSGHTSLGTPER